jgi:hypothetical protein
MEVHHHPDLHHQKSLKGYFSEFLMIFLAVTMGFFAESLRERIAGKAKEKEYIKSFISDLDEDIKFIDVQLPLFETSLAQLDSLIRLLRDSHVKEFGADIYFFGRQAAIPALRFFLINDRTIQQIKNSGGFGLIHNHKASLAIIDYYNNLPIIQVITILDVNLQNEYRRIAVDIFDPIVLETYISLEGLPSQRPAGNPALSTYDTKQLMRLAGMVAYINGTRRAYVVYEKRMRKNAQELIELLKREYHLDNK